MRIEKDKLLNKNHLEYKKRGTTLTDNSKTWRRL